MEQAAVYELRPPYLVFVGDTDDRSIAKTALGVAEWRRELCIGQCRLSAAAVDLDLPDLSPVEAAAAGARTLVVGAAVIGGAFPDSWIRSFVEAAGAGLDLVAGMHTRLADLPTVAAAASAAGTRLIDVRVPPPGLPVGNGRKRSGLRLLTVGTDCAVGKKYTALAIEREMRARAMKADFRATGQTGIMIAGRGLPIDAVVADFVSGAAEVLSPDNDPGHWDVIEGQGAITHPGFAGVTLGLLHGSQPDAIVLCHEAGLRAHKHWPDFALPALDECIDTYLGLGRRTNPGIRCVGVSVNTHGLDAPAREVMLREISNALGLPCVDPIAGGVAPIVDVLQREYEDHTREGGRE